MWIDIPGNIQTAQMPNEYDEFIPPSKYNMSFDYADIQVKLNEAKRPIVLAGYGIRQAKCVDEFVQFVEKYQIPFVSTFGGVDYTITDHPLSIGAIGIKGSRSGNFAITNADLLLVLGSSLPGSAIGYDPKQFSPGSYKIVVDIDSDELKKDIVKIDMPINVDLKEFFGAML